MKAIMPTYCKNFKCIADKCRDNCCIGWEIDIDAQTAGYYKNVGGSFGERLKNNINDGEVSCFRLCGERCPFLNENNLCDVIINLGEDRLCQICRDHPRYFEWYADRKEGGIGLCCEEAARIIVTGEEKFTTYEIPCDEEACDDYDTDLYNMLIFARNQIITTLEREDLTLKSKIFSIINYTFTLQHMIDNYNYIKTPIIFQEFDKDVFADVKGFLESFASLEPIDTNWEEYLGKLIASSDRLSENLSSETDKYDTYLKNIAIYFIWRYFLKGVYDEEILSKIRLMAVSIAMIKLMYLEAENSGEAPDGEKCSLLAKNYSKEIEYSEENLEKIYDMTYDNPAFCAENILSML